MSRPSPHSARVRVIAWVMLCMYVGLAVTLTHVPRVPSELNGYSDKSLHFVGYFAYGAFLYTAMGLTLPRQRFVWLIVLLILAGWAALDELTQPYFGRDCDILDWRADMIGVTAAVALLGTLRYFATKKRRRVRFS